jgi:hypothetical protein
MQIQKAVLKWTTAFTLSFFQREGRKRFYPIKNKRVKFFRGEFIMEAGL